jgi:ABC-2 type transport system ATP-binding protein
MPGSSDEVSGDMGADTTDRYVKVKDVSRRFGALTAVQPCSFEIFRGETVGILGSDGAGKTTLLRMIATMIPPSTGHIRINRLDADRQRSAVKPLVGYMPQHFGLYQDLTVEENINFFLNIFNIRGAERRRRRERYLGFSNLLPFLDRPAGALSGGMKQKLGLACVLVHQPELLILDEPTNGVDPVSRMEFWEILGQMKADGMTILVSTAYMDEGERCNRLILMHAGRILTIGAPDELAAGDGGLEATLIGLIEPLVHAGTKMATNGV